MLQLKQADRKQANASFFYILLYADPQWIGRCPPTLGRGISLLSLLNQILISWENTHTDTPEIMFNQGTPWPNQLTRKINHHRI